MCDCAGSDLGAARDTWSTLKLTRPPAFLHSAVKLLISHPALLTSAQCPARLVNTMALTTYECFSATPSAFSTTCTNTSDTCTAHYTVMGI